MRAIIRNQTAIEDWILEKAKYRRLHSENNSTPFVYPYNLGVWRNMRQVRISTWMNLIPPKILLAQVLTLTCEPNGDGIEWPVVEGCDQYTFTVRHTLFSNFLFIS